jgi:hypothetical protein
MVGGSTATGCPAAETEIEPYLDQPRGVFGALEVARDPVQTVSGA